MLFNEIYGITNEIPLPWWIARNPLLEWLVFNPIFQLHMKKKHKRPVVDGLRGFIAGVVYFVAIFLFFRNSNDDPEVGSRYFIALFILPTLVLIGAGFVRSMLVCLVTAPMDMRREIESYRMHSILPTPISDAGIYFSNAYQVLMRAMASNVGTLTFLLTLVIPSMIVISANGWSIYEFFYYDFGESGTIPVQMIFLFFFCTLFLYLTCLAGTMYAINLPAFAATVATVAHVGGTLLFMVLLSLIARMTVLTGVDLFFSTWQAMLLESFNLLLLILITWLTGRLGVMTFARYRRPGFFEPEYAGASGL